jgi:mannose-6-phosphate isomerase-like protein (cupin superfamily)
MEGGAMIRYVLGTCIALFCTMSVVEAQAVSAGVELISKAQLDSITASRADSLPPPTIGRLLGNRGSYTYIVLRRTQSSEVESHDEWDDVMVIQSGRATVLHGGKLEGARAPVPGELRGGTIVGGAEHLVAPGDMLILPAGVPHQVLVRENEEVVYLLIKVQKQPTPLPAARKGGV